MQALIEAFPQQLREAMAIARSIDIAPPAKRPANVAVAGLGGSAFGAEMVKNLLHHHGNAPLEILRGYTTPKWVDADTLVILSSYSGNTEETLSMAQQLIQQTRTVVTISSGGKLQALAEREGFPHVKLPEGYPPRAAVGLSFMQQLAILKQYGLYDGEFEPALEAAIQQLEAFDARTNAEALAHQLRGKLPIFYAPDELSSLGIRFRQQVNENAKQLCWHHILPEMNHNELVGWHFPTELMPSLAVVFLRSALEHPRTTLRFAITKELVSQHTTHVHEVYARGEGIVAHMLYLLHYADWVSLELARLNQIDPTPVRVIDFLKGELAKHQA